MNAPRDGDVIPIKREESTIAVVDRSVAKRIGGGIGPPGEGRRIEELVYGWIERAAIGREPIGGQYVGPRGSAKKVVGISRVGHRHRVAALPEYVSADVP